MAATTKVPHVRTPKGKSPRQLARRDANIKAAEERLAKLQEQQKADQAAKAQRVAERLAQVERENYEARYLDAALNGPVKFVLNRWLFNRPATFQRVQRFFNERPHLPQPLEPVADENKAA